MKFALLSFWSKNMTSPRCGARALKACIPVMIRSSSQTAGHIEPLRETKARSSKHLAQKKNSAKNEDKQKSDGCPRVDQEADQENGASGFWELRWISAEDRRLHERSLLSSSGGRRGGRRG